MRTSLSAAIAAVLAVSVTMAPSVSLAPASHDLHRPATSAVAAPDEQSSGRVTWSLRPGDADGPDGRAWVEWEADPGQARTEHLVVSNFGSSAVQFRLAAADGYFTDQGRFNILPSDRPSRDAGTWIDLPDEIRVAAGASEVVPFTITVPGNATPGDHPAGVAASIITPGSSTVGVESRVGFRVMTRVSGELRTAVAAAVRGGYEGHVNPFEAGSLEIAYEITNSGNTRMKTQPVVDVSGPFGVAAVQTRGEEIAEIAPGESRSGTITIPDAWPLGWYDVRVTAEAEPVTDDLAVAAGDVGEAEASIAAIPWSQVIVIVIGLLLLAWSVLQRRRTRRETVRLVAEARAEGRAEAGMTRDAAPSDAGHVRAVPADAGPERDVVPAVEPVPSSRRESRRARAYTWGVIAVAGLTLGALVLPGAPAHADPHDDSGVVIDVEVAPLPAPTPGPTQGGGPVPTPGVSTPGAPPAGRDLALTGAPDPTALLLVGGTLLAAGITVVLVLVRRHRVAGARRPAPSVPRVPQGDD